MVILSNIQRGTIINIWTCSFGYKLYRNITDVLHAVDLRIILQHTSRFHVYRILHLLFVDVCSRFHVFQGGYSAIGNKDEEVEPDV